MTFKIGSVVSHASATEWGTGKVLEVAVDRLTIQFSDGKSRKIAASHYALLQPADAAAYIAPAKVAVTAAAKIPRKTAKKKTT